MYHFQTIQCNIYGNSILGFLKKFYSQHIPWYIVKQSRIDSKVRPLRSTSKVPRYHSNNVSSVLRVLSSSRPFQFTKVDDVFRVLKLLTPFTVIYFGFNTSHLWSHYNSIMGPSTINRAFDFGLSGTSFGQGQSARHLVEGILWLELGNLLNKLAPGLNLEYTFLLEDWKQTSVNTSHSSQIV